MEEERERERQTDEVKWRERERDGCWHYYSQQMPDAAKAIDSSYMAM